MCRPAHSSGTPSAANSVFVEVPQFVELHRDLDRRWPEQHLAVRAVAPLGISVLLVVPGAARSAAAALVDVAVDDSCLGERGAELLLQLDRRLVRLALSVGEQERARELVECVLDE